MSNAFTSGFRPQFDRRGYHHGNLRETLIEAARFLVAEKGPQGFTLIEAARLADVSPAAPYRHFKDRDQLVSAVAERGFGLFADKLREATGSGVAGPMAFETLGQAYLAFAREEPGYYGAMFLAAGATGPDRPQPDRDAFGYLLEAVRRVMAAPGAPPRDPMPLAMQIWALAHGVATLSATGRWPSAPGAPSPDEVLRQGAAAILRGEQASPR